MTLYIITMMAKIDVVQHLGQVSHLAKAYFGFCGMTPVLVLLLLPLDAKLVHYMLPSWQCHQTHLYSCCLKSIQASNCTKKELYWIFLLKVQISHKPWVILTHLWTTVPWVIKRHHIPARSQTWTTRWQVQCAKVETRITLNLKIWKWKHDSLLTLSEALHIYSKETQLCCIQQTIQL